MINKPLAYRMRPKYIDEVLGQNKVISFLKNLIANETLISLVFYGTPGSGKTTTALAFANTYKINSYLLNAVLDNKAKMEETFQEAIRFNPAIVIIDEIHRLDKGKQDLLLPHLERGDFYLIGCTSANPYVKLNPAIRSRTRLLEFTPLTSIDVLRGLTKASKEDSLLKEKKITDEALSYLAKISAGDLRFAYNQLEALSLSFSKSHEINLQDAKDIAQSNYLADKDDDEHYNTVSALQKSIRGSDVDAALYYLAKLLRGEDLEGLIRRLLVTAYEDIGLANPPAVDRCFNACQVAREVGLPEARIPLAFTVTDLTLSPKSKSAIKAVDEALKSIDSLPLQVRNYLKLKGTHLSEEESYPYGEKDIWPHLKYLPVEIENKEFYHPETSGKYERALKENLEKLKKEKRFSKVSEARKYIKNGRKDSV